MYCPNCGKKLPDGAKFCTNCGAKIDAEINEAANRQNLKYDKNQVDINGHKIGPDGQWHEEEKNDSKKKGRGIFIVLCAIIAVLAVGIVWEVVSLVQINQNTNTFTLPKIQTESTITEADSGISGVDSGM